MKYYRIWTATEIIDIEADGCRVEGTYELNIPGQQPSIVFLRGYNNKVGMFMLKNIAGWKEITQKEYLSAPIER